MKTIVIISDTHNKELPDGLIKDLEQCDIIIHAGDITSVKYYDKLVSYNKTIYAVQGNMDRGKLEELLPVKKTFNIENKNFALMHGWGSPKNLHKKIEREFKNYNWDILIYGHSHSPTEIKKNNRLILNPGSPTEKRFAPKNTYIKLNISKNNIDYQFIEI